MEVVDWVEILTKEILSRVAEGGQRSFRKRKGGGYKEGIDKG